MVYALSTVLLFLFTLTAGAQGYSYTTVDAPFPDSCCTVVTSVNATGELVGIYTDAHQHVHGFWLRGDGCAVPLLYSTPRGLSNAGTVVGFVQPPRETRTEAFIYQAGSVQRFTGPFPRGGPFPLETAALGINEAGGIVGTVLSAVDEKLRGFRRLGTLVTIIEAPDALETRVVGVDNLGRLVGMVLGTDNVRRAFRWEEGVGFTFLTIPNLPTVEVVGHTESGVLAGNANGQGVVYDGTTVQMIAVPGATVTDLFGIREQGGHITVWGRYIGTDAVHHGFVATSAPAPEPTPEPEERRPDKRRGQEKRR